MVWVAEARYKWRFYNLTTVIPNQKWTAQICYRNDTPSCLSYNSTHGLVIDKINRNTVTIERGGEVFYFLISFPYITPTPVVEVELNTFAHDNWTVAASVSPSWPTYSTGTSGYSDLGNMTANFMWSLLLCHPPKPSIRNVGLYMRSWSHEFRSSSTILTHQTVNSGSVSQSTTWNTKPTWLGYPMTTNITDVWVYLTMNLGGASPTNCYYFSVQSNWGWTFYNQQFYDAAYHPKSYFLLG
jgi:hypothetical protein